MKRRLQFLAVCLTALLAVRMMAQDTGGGAAAGGGGGGDNSGAPAGGDNGAGQGAGGQNNGGDNSGDMNGGNNEGTGLPTGGGDNNGGAGTGSTPGTGDLFGPGTGTEGTGAGSTIVPEGGAPAASPGELAPTTGGSASPSPTPAPSGETPGASAALEAPVTLTLPGGYGSAAGSTSFTLGEGRLAKPPITFTLSVSQGYDDNIFSADGHPKATPTPIPEPTPPLEARIIGYRFHEPSPPTPILEYFRPQAAPTPTPPGPGPGVVGSPVTSLTVGAQIQKGTPRSVVTGDISVGAQDYYNQPGSGIDYNANVDLQFVEKLSPRAQFSINFSAAYQNTPNFALVNAPTNNATNTNYLNGNFFASLSYQWSARIATVTSYNLAFNLLQTNAQDNLYETTIGTQFRYTVSPRTTVTAELRETLGDYPSNAVANNTTTSYLLGLDTFLSSRLHNTFSAGFEVHTFNSSGAGQTLPYFESDTTFQMPRGAALFWTNVYGFQESNSPTQTVKSYRTSFGYSQPLSAKLVGNLSIAYNYLETTDSVTPTNGNNQSQFQVSVSLGYTVSPRLSLSLSYNYLDFLTTVINSSYTRDQIYLGGTYTFQ